MLKIRIFLFCLLIFIGCKNPQSASDANSNDSGITGYSVVDTGQIKFFNNVSGSTSSEPAVGEPFYGQDAHYQGNAASYTDNGDNTVSDNVTGLMWQKGFVRSTFADAASKAAAATTGGYTDWRVPTTKELYSLINFTGNQGSGSQTTHDDVPDDAVAFIDRNYFDFEYPSDADLRYIDAQYLVSTVYVGTVMNGEKAFFGVNFADGRIKGYPLTPQNGRTWYLKLVRDNTSYGENNFTDNNNGTISDHATGLMWSKVDSGDSQFSSLLSGYKYTDGSLNWQEALAFVASINSGEGYAGHTDWRLPNAKELHTIVDYSRAPDVTSSPAIDEMFETTQIPNEANTRIEDDYPFFWTSTSFEPGQDAVIIQFGRSWGKDLGGNIVDVHGAGGQRTDDKIVGGEEWFGPQNDLNRVYNYVRLVRDM